MRPLVIALVAAVCATAPATRAHAAQAPADTRPSHDFRFSGWTRSSVEVTSAAEPSPADRARGIEVPHDNVVARELLHVRGRYARGEGFEAVGSALVTLAVARPSVSAGNDALRSEAGIKLRDAFIGFPAGDFNVRAGVQRIAWGHGDLISPNDVLNPRDLRDPILNETELRYAPTLALRVDIELHRTALQLVVDPLFEPDSYDTYGPNWALIQPDAPPGYRGLLKIVSARPGVSQDDAGTALLVDAPRPRGLSGVQRGARFDWHAGRLDVSHYYHYGYHRTPNFRVASFATTALNSIDWSSASPDNVGSVLAEMTGAVDASWQRRHHVGLDVGAAAGSFLLRLDTAYQDRALFYDPAFNGWAAPAIETVAGVEYQAADLRRTVLVETRYRRILKNVPDSRLLYTDQEGIDAGVLSRWTLGNIEIEARALGALHPRSLVLRPQVAWRRRGYTLRTGLVALTGGERSFGRWYRRNRSVYLTLRKDF